MKYLGYKNVKPLFVMLIIQKILQIKIKKNI